VEHSENVSHTAMRAVYPYVHTLVKLKLTISCTTASMERCLSKMAVLQILYTCEITAEKTDWVAVALMILHRNVKVT